MFLDRDDTLMADVPYCARPEDVRVLPGAAEGVRRIRELGFLVVVITNQSGIARRLFTEDDLRAVNAELERQLAAGGGHIDALYHCPHMPDAGCACRKPGTLLFERAIADHGIDPGRSYAVGDRGADLVAGRKVGATPVLLRNPTGLAEVEAAGLTPALVCADLPEFAAWLEGRGRQRDIRTGEIK